MNCAFRGNGAETVLIGSKQAREMEIVIHRGTHQIGGCATEVRTDRTRILIDFGSELPGSSQAGGASHEPLRIDGLNAGSPAFDAVLFTHHHEDHLGMAPQISVDVPLYLGRRAAELYRYCAARRVRHAPDAFAVAARLRKLDVFLPITIGDLRITPLPADHSAWDSLMYLIEGEGLKILHTGDFRLHGFRGKATLPILESYASGVDVLITEGTQLSSRHASIPEKELQRRIRKVIAGNKYVFVLCASTNIDRLASIHNATPRGRYFLCDAYQKELLRFVSESALSDWYRFQKVLTYGQNLKYNLRQRGFVMAVRASDKFRRIVEEYPNSILVYSMWDGYLQGRNPSIGSFCQPFHESGRLVYLHTSGHASPGDLRQLCETIRPRFGVIPIHGEKPEEFRNFGLSSEIITLGDGQPLRIPAKLPAGRVSAELRKGLGI